MCPGRESNPRLLGRKSDALTTAPPSILPRSLVLWCQAMNLNIICTQHDHITCLATSTLISCNISDTYSINERTFVLVFQDSVSRQMSPDVVDAVVALLQAWKTIVQILDDEHLYSEVQRYTTSHTAARYSATQRHIQRRTMNRHLVITQYIPCSINRHLVITQYIPCSITVSSLHQFLLRLSSK